MTYSLVFAVSIERYIKDWRQCFTGYPNTSNFVENTPLRVVFFLTRLFSLFGYPGDTLSLVSDILHQGYIPVE